MVVTRTKQPAAQEEGCQSVCFNPKQVRSIQRRLPSRDGIERLVEFYKSFANSSRLTILLALSKGELCVCDLAAVMGASPSAVSHQLRLLRSEKVVKVRRSGKMSFYSLDDQHVESVLQMALEHLVERKQR